MSSYIQQRNPGRMVAGFGLIVLLHVGAAIVVVDALSKQNVDKLRQPLETKILDDVKPPPPPDLPPPPPPPPQQAPPPVFIPPPEIVINTPAPPPPVQVAVVAPPPAPVPVARPAPAAPPPVVEDTSVSAHAIGGPAQVYPKRMLESGREGSVDLTCDVDVDGSTSNCEVVTSTNSAFADSALDYVKHAKYRPATHNGAPVKETHHRFTITYKLN
jgi:periplasmic protein TonB